MCRDPWVLPLDPGARRAATATKQRLSESVGGASDHLLLVKAYNQWAGLLPRQQHGYAASNFMNNGTMLMIHGMRQQLVTELVNRGLITSVASVSANADNPGIVRCVLVRELSVPRPGASVTRQT